MNNQLLISLFLILAFSCKAPVSSRCQNGLSVAAAEKTEWFGGRPGVRGTSYEVVLKLKNSRDTITVKSFKAEGNTISFTQSISGNSITVRGNYQKPDEINTIEYSPSAPSVEKSEKLTISNPTDNWLEYTVNGSKKSYKIIIPTFYSVEPEEELIPRR